MGEISIMIHLTNRNLQIRIGNQNFELLAVYYVSAISIMTFAKTPMTNIYRLLTICITHPQFAEFTIFLAFKENSVFQIQHPIYIA